MSNWDKETERKKNQENLQTSNEFVVNIKHVADKAKFFMSFHRQGDSQYN